MSLADRFPVCVCNLAYNREQFHNSKIILWPCAVCVGRERERETDGDRDRERQGECVRER